MLRVELLGERRLLHGAVDAGPGIQYRKAWALLGYLVLEGGQRQTREQLAELLWPSLPAASARTNLRQVLANLNRVLEAHGGAGWLAVSRDEVGLTPAPRVAVDVHELARAAEETDIERLIAVRIGGNGGEFLAGLDFDDCPRFATWLQMERSRLAAVSRRALLRIVEAQLSVGDAKAATGTARRLATLDPWDEAGQRQWMAALAADGRLDEALAAFDRYAELLAQELGGLPSPSLVAFREAIAAAVRSGAARLLPAPASPRTLPRQWACGIACRLEGGTAPEVAMAELGVLAQARGALLLSSGGETAWFGVPADGPPGSMGAAASRAARIAQDLVARVEGRLSVALCPALVQRPLHGMATPLGNPSEAASDLLAHACPGAVLVCESLFPDLFESFVLHPRVDVVLPGLERPMRVWRLGTEGQGGDATTTGRLPLPGDRPLPPEALGAELLTLRLGEAPSPDEEDAVDTAWLTVVEGADRGKRVGVSEAPVIIGRSPEADLQLPRRTVSRHHCVVWRDADRFRLRDLGATNRTRVNGAAVIDALLAEGDTVSVGECVLRLGRDD